MATCHHLVVGSLRDRISSGRADIDSDGDVDSNDLNVLLRNFGAVPETSSAAQVVAVSIGPTLPETTDSTEPTIAAIGPRHRLESNIQFTTVSRPKIRAFPGSQELPPARERARVQDAAIIAAMQAEQRTSRRTSRQHNSNRWGEEVDLLFGRTDKEDLFRNPDRQ